MGLPTLPVILLDVIEATVVCRSTDQISLNRFFYKCTAFAGTGVHMQNVADDFDGAIHAFYKDVLSIHAEYYGVMVRKVWPLKSVSYSTKSHLGVGTAAGDLLPRQVCGLVTKQTTGSGPANRGRVYMPFPAESCNDTDSTPTADYKTDMNSLAAVLFANQNYGAGANTVTLAPCLYNGNVLGNVTIITGFDARPRFATQRRRGSYGRTNLPPF